MSVFDFGCGYFLAVTYRRKYSKDSLKNNIFVILILYDVVWPWSYWPKILTKLKSAINPAYLVSWSQDFRETEASGLPNPSSRLICIAILPPLCFFRSHTALSIREIPPVAFMSVWMASINVMQRNEVTGISTIHHSVQICNPCWNEHTTSISLLNSYFGIKHQHLRLGAQRTASKCHQY